MRRSLGAAIWALALVALAAPGAACSGPRYPSCDNDEQCNTDGHKGVCLDHNCTECRDDKGCPAGQQCTSGACAEIPNFCDDSRPCGDGSDCGADKRCHKKEAVAVECDDAHFCQGTSHCENGHCVAPPHGGPGCTDFPAVHFDYDSKEFPADALQVLQRLAGCVTTGSLKTAKVLLTGHCDPRGEYEYNMVLGADRAEGVKQQLTRLGVPEPRITTSSRGKLDAVGTDEGSWAKDRRVDIEIR